MPNPLAAVIVAEAIVPTTQQVANAEDRRARRSAARLDAGRPPWRRRVRVSADPVRRTAVV
jgi:hypothetical protein